LRFPLEPREPVRVRREGVGEHLQGIVPLERRVMRAPDLAHPPLANQGGDFIRPDAAPGADGHPGEFYAEVLTGGGDQPSVHPAALDDIISVWSP
jgi:hypothetical protein